MISNLKTVEGGGVKPASYINAIPRIQRKPRNPLKTINYYDYQPSKAESSSSFLGGGGTRDRFFRLPEKQGGMQDEEVLLRLFGV